jgi:hypothetical protein
LPHYFETALPLTLLMIWIIVALSSGSAGEYGEETVVARYFTREDVSKKAQRSVEEPVEYSFAGFALRGDVIFLVLEHLIPYNLGICIPNPV